MGKLSELEKGFLMDDWKLIIQEAKEKCLWFHFPRVAVFLSPDELEQHQKEGRYIWGTKNHVLIEPAEIINRKQQQIQRINDEIDELRKRIFGK